MTVKEEFTVYFNINRRRLMKLLAAVIAILVAATIFFIFQLTSSRTLLQAELAKVEDEKQQLQGNYDDALVRIDSLTTEIDKLKAKVSNFNTLSSGH